MGKHRKRKKKPKKARKPLGPNPFLVKTPLGESLLNSSSLVYVHLGGDLHKNWARKKARELSSGEVVLFDKQKELQVAEDACAWTVWRRIFSKEPDISKLVSYYRDRYAAARIVGVEDTQAKGKESGGIVTHLAGGFEIKPLKRFEREKNLTGYVYMRLMFAHCYDPVPVQGVNFVDFRNALVSMYGASEDDRKRMAHVISKARTAGYDMGNPYPDTAPSQKSIEHAERFLVATHDGSMDAKYFCEPGAILSLVDTYYRLQGAIPFDMSLAAILQGQIVRGALGKMANGADVNIPKEIKKFTTLVKRLRHEPASPGELTAVENMNRIAVMTPATDLIAMATESSPATLVRAFKLADEYAKDQVALDILEDLGLSGVAHLFQRSYQKLFDFPTMPPTSMH